MLDHQMASEGGGAFLHSTGGTLFVGTGDAGGTRGLINGGILMVAFKIPHKIRLNYERPND